MKKRLFTCFLAWLCLIGSTPTLSQVADSPQPPGSTEQAPAEQEGKWYLEIAAENPPDTLYLTFWEHLLQDSQEVTPGTQITLIGEKGTFFEGSQGTRLFSWTIPPNLSDGYASLSLNQKTIYHQWTFNQKDRVRMRIDLSTGQTLFGGPKADFYRVQYLVDQAFAEEKFNSDPLLISSRSHGLFSDPVSQAAYQKAHSQAGDLHVRMQVLVPEENGWDYLRQYQSKSADQHPAWAILKNQKDRLTEKEFGQLQSRILGEILLNATKKAERISTQLTRSPEKGSKFLAWFSGMDSLIGGASHPKLIQGISRLEILSSKINRDNILDRLGTYPNPLGDELLAFFILSNFNRLEENLDSYLSTAMNQVSTPWIKERLDYLKEVQLGPFKSDGLYDEEGKPADLGKLKGKTLLVHYWISGCKFCRDDFQRSLDPLLQELEADSDILLVSVNADGRTDTWKASLKSGMYTAPEMLNLRAEKGVGVLERYKIHSFPQKMIIGPDSKIRMQTLDKMGPAQLEHVLNRIHNDSIPNHQNPPTK
ncbi:hypothetical protein [Algoriphagus sp.]|uniref:TlpA family protein disulfide reductase n=1 Tax=Algoriphagus sp. TaxID=1872435 RepID=UPI002635EBA8|nr:hypothetical protein [Algoriphagus sp.]